MQVSPRPDISAWVDEVKARPDFDGAGMLLVHNGVVRANSRSGAQVAGMRLGVDRERLREVLTRVQVMPGILEARAWVNEGELKVGDDIMLALVAGDIRENVFAGLQTLVAGIKGEVVQEEEIRA